MAPLLAEAGVGAPGEDISVAVKFRLFVEEVEAAALRGQLREGGAGVTIPRPGVAENEHSQPSAWRQGHAGRELERAIHADFDFKSSHACKLPKERQVPRVKFAASACGET